MSPLGFLIPASYLLPRPPLTAAGGWGEGSRQLRELGAAAAATTWGVCKVESPYVLGLYCVYAHVKEFLDALLKALPKRARRVRLG